MNGLLLMLGVMALMAFASRGVQASFQKYSQVPIRSRMTGAQAARQILDANGLQNVAIERVAGQLTDHYDPQKRVLRLSSVVYDQPSVASVGVAAHEAGHALQHKNGYAPLMIRQGMIPIVNFGSAFGMNMIMVGMLALFFLSQQLGFMIGIIGLALYSLAVLCSIITLPVEFNASSRALACLNQYGIVSSEEHSGTKKVLNAAALTYVAAAVGSVLTLLYYASFFLGGNRE